MMKTNRPIRWLGVCAALVTVLPGAIEAQSDVQLVSVNRRGETGDLPSQSPAVSGDGRYVAFASDAINLRALNDRRPFRDVFVRDRVTSTTEKISIAFDGSEADGDSQPGNLASPAINLNGCVVAYSSLATNLIEDDANGFEDIFVRDRCSGTTEKISQATDGGPSNGASSFAALSYGGRWVVFQSTASNLVDGDTNGKADIFVFDRESRTTRRVSVADLTGDESNGDSVIPAISGNGEVVAFESTASNLSEGANGDRQVFVHVIATGRTELASRSASNSTGNNKSFCPALDEDGSIVAFKSDASNLVAGDSNGVADTFARDRDAETIQRVSVDSFGNPARSLSAHPSVSADGRYIAFPSFDGFFDPDDDNNQPDVFVHDRLGEEGNRTVRVSVEVFGLADGGAAEAPPSISANGKWIGFASTSTKFLAPDVDRNNAYDAFISCNPLAPPCPPECLSDSDCGDLRVCDPTTNSCIDVTATDTPTEVPTATDTPTRPAVSPTVTRTNSRTPTPTNLILTPTPSRTPGRPCDGDEDCDPGMRCEDGTCVAIPCEDNSDCPANSMCEDGMCVPYPCDEDSDCPAGLECENMICVGTPCQTDADCPPASECIEDMCTPIRCDEDSDCPPGSECAPENDICVAIPCTTDNDCPDTAMCEDGQCVPIPCDDNSDCPPGSNCDLEDDICRPIPCDNNSDCPEPSMCTDGQCIPIPCDMDEDCPNGNVCDEQQMYCVPDSGGGGGGGCSCEIDPSKHPASMPEGLMFLLPAALLWWRRRAPI